MSTVCVLGLGYIGLPTAAMLANHGYQVHGVDINDRIVAALRDGHVHLQEPGLDEWVHQALESGRLLVSGEPVAADAFIIAVPTPCVHGAQAGHPPNATLPEADLAYVIAAAESIVPYLKPGNLVVLESTVPPQTTTGVLRPILQRAGLPVAGGEGEAEDPNAVLVAHCPERVLPGRILQELVHNDRVIGGANRISAERAREIYASFVEGQIFITEATTAEMVKLMENTFRDVNIALANELALVAERVGIDVWQAIELANRHPRVKILKPGPGVGGHCIAVDPWFIAQTAADITPLIQTARHVNDGMAAHVVDLVRQALDGEQAPVVACLGLTYKADVDDTRESPAIAVVHQLQQAGIEVRAFDPHVTDSNGLGGVLRDSLEATLQGADCAVLLTDHQEFRSLPPRSLDLMHRPTIVDARHALDDSLWQGQKRIILGVAQRQEEMDGQPQVQEHRLDRF